MVASSVYGIDFIHPLYKTLNLYIIYIRYIHTYISEYAVTDNERSVVLNIGVPWFGYWFCYLYLHKSLIVIYNICKISDTYIIYMYIRHRDVHTYTYL